MYSQKVMEHFMNPLNVGRMPYADGEGMVGDPKCGDALNIYIRIQFRTITDIRFEGFGCDACVAIGSKITVLAKGKCIEEAMAISEQDVINSLDGLPDEDKHCAFLGVSALRKAIENYAVKRGIYSCQIDNEDSSEPKAFFSIKK